MAIKHNEVNPLDVAGLRRLDFVPPHFVKILYDAKATEKVVSDWIYENMEGRFYVGQYVSRPESGHDKATLTTCAAFELPGEASYFALMLPEINRYEYDIG